MTRAQKNADKLAKGLKAGEVKPIARKPGKKADAQAPKKADVQTPPIQAPVQTQASEPAVIVPPKPASLRDLLKKKATATSTIVSAIRESDDAIKDEGVFRAFLDAIDGALVLAQHREPDRGQDLVREWDRLTFEQIVERLDEWSNDGDSAAAGILDVLKTFKGEETPGTVKVDVIPPLWERVVMVRELRTIRTYAALSAWIHRMHNIGNVRCFSGQQVGKSNIVLMGKDGHSAIQYIPTAKKTTAVWQFALEAQERAKVLALGLPARIETLRRLDTGLTGIEAKDGKDGKVFRQLAGVNRCILLDFHSNGNGLEVKVVTGVGINFRQKGHVSPHKLEDAEIRIAVLKFLDGQ